MPAEKFIFKFPWGYSFVRLVTIFFFAALLTRHTQNPLEQVVNLSGNRHADMDTKEKKNSAESVTNGYRQEGRLFETIIFRI